MIDAQVAEVVKERDQRLENDADFQELKNFYAEMQRLGFAKQSEYGLPPVDTVGALYARKNDV
jgi:hypothetical protein